MTTRTQSRWTKGEEAENLHLARHIRLAHGAQGNLFEIIGFTEDLFMIYRSDVSTVGKVDVDKFEIARDYARQFLRYGNVTTWDFLNGLSSGQSDFYPLSVKGG